jgi:para-nitrobenzyl esterase
MTGAGMLVTLREGALRGDDAGAALAFRGIPYARAPVGALRFAPPAPAESWSGERDATRFAAAPPQRPDPLGTALGMLAGAEIGEDCLALNVFTPGLGGPARPVLVWLPGGAFASGTAGVPLYDGARLAARADVVVVTVSYRVGALGFAYLDAEGREPAASNLGLQDQVAALRWVRANVAAFGGDPARVTVFGESAGAGSILALAGMPAAQGLFAGAIVSSAAPRGALTREEARERTRLWLAELGLADASRRALRALPVEAILDAQSALVARGGFRTGMCYAPVLDDTVLTAPPWLAFAEGWARDLPLVIGTTRDEMHLYWAGVPKRDDGAIALIAPQLALPEADARRAAQILVDGFRGARERRGEPASPCDVYLAIQTELSLRRDAIAIAEARAADRRTWMYLFGWRSPARDGVMGACHALDLPFLFGNLDAPGMPAFAGEGAEARALSERIMDAWAAFARSGDPGWPPYDAARRPTLELARVTELREAPLDEERVLIERYAGASAGT